MGLQKLQCPKCPFRDPQRMDFSPFPGVLLKYFFSSHPRLEKNVVHKTNRNPYNRFELLFVILNRIESCWFCHNFSNFSFSVWNFALMFTLLGQSCTAQCTVHRRPCRRPIRAKISAFAGMGWFCPSLVPFRVAETSRF